LFPSARRVLKLRNVPAEGDIIANRFRLVRELGRGSMGTVWLAHHLALEVPCAIKFIVSESSNNPTYRARFHIEARTIAQLQSPNVVRVLDHSLGDDAAPYIAMEFLDGEDLWSRLLREGRLSARATYKVVSQVARGLAKAHAAGISHRDLKPENIFLAREGEEEVVKLLDFGVAKWKAPSPLDKTEGLVGTPEYMSPELARGAAGADHRSDLWALAVVAYQCLTGQLPFAGESLVEILAHITVGPIPVPSEIASHVSSDFDRWWARATSRTIEERFQSALELSDALGETLGLNEAGRTERVPRRASASSLPPMEATFVSAVERDSRSYRPSERAVMRMKLPALAAGLVGALVALLVATGHYGASFARATLAAPRVAAAGNTLTVHSAPPPFVLEALAPPVDSSAPPRDSLQRAVAPAETQLPVVRSPRVPVSLPMARPPRADRPNADIPKTPAPPKLGELPKQEAVVDFGI
jgi:serine/threonine-protein kinase